MNEDNDQNNPMSVPAALDAPVAPSCDGATLLARYGDFLPDEPGEQPISEADKQALLMTLWAIMRAFVDLGFDIKSGEKFAPDSTIGMDDVLRYLIPNDTAQK